MKKNKTIDDQIWSDIDKALAGTGRVKVTESHQMSLVSYGALHVSGARQTKKAVQQEQLDRANELLLQVCVQMTAKGKVSWNVYEKIEKYLTDKKLI